MFNNSKLLNTKFVFLGTRGDTIYECADKQRVLRKEQKTYRKAIAQFCGFMDELEGINAFLVSTFSNYTSADSNEENKLHNWQQRIINLYIQLIADTAVYEDKIQELQDMIDALQAIIDGFCENGSGVGARISYYQTQISKLINEIQEACDQLGIEFKYQPISHGSKKVHTIYHQLYEVVMKEYDKQKNDNLTDDYVDGQRYNESDAEPSKNESIADEIANALMNSEVNPASTILGISNFANGEEYKFQTSYNGKSVDFVKDDVIDVQDIAELTDAINNQEEKTQNMTDEEKTEFVDKYDVNADSELNKDDIEAASSLIYQHTSDPENTPSVELQNVEKEVAESDAHTNDESLVESENPVEQ